MCWAESAIGKPANLYGGKFPRTEGISQLSNPDIQDGNITRDNLAQSEVSPQTSSLGQEYKDVSISKPRIGDSRPSAVPIQRASRSARSDNKPLNDTSVNTRKSKPAGKPQGSKRTVAPSSEGDFPTQSQSAPPKPIELDLDQGLESQARLKRQRPARGARQKRQVGRFVMVVHSMSEAIQIAILEGRSLVRHHVATLADSDTQIDGNIYLGRVQNVLPGMEAAFIDIGTPKNAVLYQGDLRSGSNSSDLEDIDTDEQEVPNTRNRKDQRNHRNTTRIEDILKAKQMIVCQVTKNPIGAKGARLTQEVSLPGRFVVLVPGSDAYGISKRLRDEERKRLRQILDRVRPKGHGLIVRTAAEGASEEELKHDVSMLVNMWEKISKLSETTIEPTLLYKEPNMALRLIREEFNKDFRAIYIDNVDMYEKVNNYVASISPELEDRVIFYDTKEETLPVFERFHVHEQLHRALERKVWLPSGGSLVIDSAEALTVIDVNTGKNVGTSNLEETVFRTNLEAADEVARQLQLRDIGGIIVVDFIDMEIRDNRDTVMKTLRDSLSRDKTRTQAFDMSELCLVEMTRKRISEGLVQSLSHTCDYCGGRGIIFDDLVS